MQEFIKLSFLTKELIAKCTLEIWTQIIMQTWESRLGHAGNLFKFSTYCVKPPRQDKQ